MLVSDSPLLGFRALQAIMDLRSSAGRQPRSAIKGIAARIPPTDRNRGADEQALTRLILHQGARLESEKDRPLLDALQLAASQPEADPDAFVAATAILLADRLQSGLGQEDMGLYWDSFHAAYFELHPHDRAAIVQGFLAGAAFGRVRMGSPRPELAHLSNTTEVVRSGLLKTAGEGRTQLLASVTEHVGAQMSTLILPQLRSLLAGVSQQPLTGDSPLFEPLLSMAANSNHAACLPATALLLSQAALTGDEEGWFAVTLWPDMVSSWLALNGDAGRPILAGLRHLYETDPDWIPMPNRMASPQDMSGLALLPVLDGSFAGGRSGARVG